MRVSWQASRRTGPYRERERRDQFLKQRLQGVDPHNKDQAAVSTSWLLLLLLRLRLLLPPLVLLLLIITAN